MKQFSQLTRLVILLLYIVILSAISYFIHGSIIPPTTEMGIWFYSCIASIILGDLITSPFFTSPAETIANSTAALISLAAVNAWTLGLSDLSKWIWLVAIAFNILMVFIAFFQIAIKDLTHQTWINLTRVLYEISKKLGNHRVVFSTVIFYALISFHSNSPGEYIPISTVWFALVAVHPLEWLWGFILKIREIFSDLHPNRVGIITGHEYPNIVLIKCQPETRINLGDSLIVQGDDGRITVGFALDQLGFTGELWHRVLIFIDSPKSDVNRNDLRLHIKQSGAYKYPEDSTQDPAIQARSEDIKKHLIGIVSSDSDISSIRVEIVRTDMDLHEGRLVSVKIGHEDVLYQIVDGFTKEEIIEQRNSRGYVRAESRKIGKWTTEGFQTVRWVPLPNSPVFLVDVNTPPFNPNAIGFIPHTNYHLTVDFNSLVTHNTAILGILGVGKTCLALELIERMAGLGIKVICLDLTNQYEEELSPYCDNLTSEIADLQQIGKQGKTKMQPNVEEGGSIREFKQKIREQLKKFLSPSKKEMVRVYNPASFEVWKQDSKIYSNVAAMATLSACEITRIISETTLDILQEMGIEDHARCCLVFEEAHSLIPEWNSVANEGDKSATNGTAKAILQGRKYGLGCIVITQRTANVTKSVLNQCNTVFALRTFDATGVEFLKTFVGNDYASVLNDLEDRHAIAFGKATSCKTPVVIRLNDRSLFLENCRTDKEPTTNADMQLDDDIPF